MEIGPFRTVSESKTKSGMVEVELVEGGWEEYATVIFSELASSPFLDEDLQLMYPVDQPPGTGYSFVPTNGYLHDLDEVSSLDLWHPDRIRS